VLKLQIPSLGAKFPFILVSNFTAEESRISIKIAEKPAANAKKSDKFMQLLNSPMCDQNKKCDTKIKKKQ
jgi:hypothetical protein